MAFEELNQLINGQLSDFYCVVKDNDQDFYWAINLENHPASFILDSSYQHLIKSHATKDTESMVIKLPLIK